MELSIVLWNCKGLGVVAERVDSCESTMKSWKRHGIVPTVVLAQEVKGKVRDKWIEYSSVHSERDHRETACFFPDNNDNVELLSSGDLMDIKQSMVFQSEEVDVARIQCAIMTIKCEKILICSWHGPHVGYNDDTKKPFLRNMLEFADKIKVDRDCCAALVGGDFNLNSSDAKHFMLESGKPKNAVLYDCYDKPSFRPKLIDYVIAWPNDRVSQNSCRVIDTVPHQPKPEEDRMFDHALIRYNFTVRLKGEWEGDGEVTWCGECGEGRVHVKNYVRIKGVESGKSKGFDQVGYCKNCVCGAIRS